MNKSNTIKCLINQLQNQINKDKSATRLLEFHIQRIKKLDYWKKKLEKETTLE